MSANAPRSLAWNSSTLQSMRQVGDPLADAVITELFAANEVAAVNSLMRTLIVNEYPPPDALPTVVRDYLAQTDVLPEWANSDLLKAGEQVFWCYGPQLILILHCYGLPFCYLGQNGVRVLALTTRLVSNPTRRVLETAQMVIDVMQAGGLTTPTGRGRRTIQKVRLMHAAIRRLAPTAPSWNPDFGVPVNQEDLAGTLMAFSWISLDGLARLDYTLSDQEREAYLHSWRVVGHLLGIDQTMLPANVASAEALVQAIAAHEFGATADGQELTRALLKMMANILPGSLLQHAPALFVRYFLGKEHAECLGINEGKLIELASLPLRALGFDLSKILEDCSVARKFAEHVGQLLVNSLVYIERGGNRPSFAIPSELRQQWGVNWTS